MSAADLETVLARPAWAIIRLPDEESLVALGGTRVDYERLLDVPLEAGPPDHGRRFDRLLCVPFSQVRERGFPAHDDGTPLSALDLDVELEVTAADVADLASEEALEAVGTSGFTTSDDEYAALVRRVIDDEIGHGEGANLVVAREFRATIADWGRDRALGVLARLLEQERGAYWTFLVFTGDRYLVGASPERHVWVQHETVSMNPISGTLRLTDVADPEGMKPALLRFLADEKEIYELFMVVDEELKMMCSLCAEGGAVLGPFLKPMSRLVHTEYRLEGRSGLDVREILRDSMFAATVTGSPVENACRLITAYEPAGRGYYGSVLALLGRDTSGAATLDAPIVLRTADVDLAGRLRVLAGATLVRDSDPASEVAETRAKAAGILKAFGLASSPAAVPAQVSQAAADVAADPDVVAALRARNARLSEFWMADQADTRDSLPFAGRTAVVLDGEDAFVSMLCHVLNRLGVGTSVVSHRDYAAGSLDGFDLVVVGPGPGDPRDLSDPKIATVRRAVDSLLACRQPFLAVCLGHQVLSGALGLDLAFKDVVFQGTQTEIDVLGRRERVGFYNTFVARIPAAGLPSGVSVDADPVTGDVHLVRGPHFVGIQFHAESILSSHGSAIIADIVGSLL